MGKLDLVIVAQNRNGDTKVINPNNDWKVKDFIHALAQDGYLNIKLVYVEELEL